MNQNATLLAGRMDAPVNELTSLYTASIPFDYRLARQDIEGSLAHATMLCEQKIISKEDFAQIEQGLKAIGEAIERGEFSWDMALEDVHMNIEKRLIERIGEAGKRLHTGRSRNDQVATDMRLFVRQAIDALRAQIHALQRSLITLAQAHTETIMPGFTHLQVAQPISFAHHLLAYYEMLTRDDERFIDCRRRTNRLPLGSAALAGTTYPINRARVAQLLNFDEVCGNSLDAVSDRDFAIEFVSASSICMMHLSRFSEELILWMNPLWGFIDLAEGFCTTSSIMPQKKNPDVPELVRGKSGRIFGHLIALLTVMKAQPLAYNKDNQEDKEPLFDTVDTLLATLKIYTAMVGGIEVKPQAMKKALDYGHAAATDLADYLVRQGMSFRQAHHAVAQAVNHASKLGKDLSALTLAQLQAIIAEADSGAIRAMAWDNVLSARAHVGGTAPSAVRSAIAAAQERLAKLPDAE